MKFPWSAYAVAKILELKDNLDRLKYREGTGTAFKACHDSIREDLRRNGQDSFIPHCTVPAIDEELRRLRKFVRNGPAIGASIAEMKVVSAYLYDKEAFRTYLEEPSPESAISFRSSGKALPEEVKERSPVARKPLAYETSAAPSEEEHFVRKPWDLDEAILLVEGYRLSSTGWVKRTEAIAAISALLRKRALDQGQQIQEKFRNVPGISLHLAFIEGVMKNRVRSTGHGSKVMREAVEMYVLRAGDFVERVRELKRQGYDLEGEILRIRNHARKGRAVKRGAISGRDREKQSYEEKKKPVQGESKAAFPNLGSPEGWNQYEVARLLYTCLQVEKESSFMPILKDLSHRLTKYARECGLSQDGSRSVAEINRRLLQMDYLLTEGKRGRPGSPAEDKEMVRLYRTDPQEYQKILQRANELLGYDSAKASQEESGSETIREEAERYRAVMEAHFSNGIRMDSQLDFDQFCKRYESIYHGKVRETVYKAVLPKITYQQNGRCYLENNREQDAFLHGILEELQGLFDAGYTCLSMDCVYPHYAARLGENLGIYDEASFRSALDRGAKGRFKINGFGHILCQGREANTEEDVCRYLREKGGEVTYGEMEQDLWFLPLNKIKQVIRSTSSIINTAHSTYMSIENFPIDRSGELPQIKEVLAKAIRQSPRGQLQAEECRRVVYGECPSVKLNTEMFSLAGFHNALWYFLGKDFSFSRTYVSAKESTVDTSADLYREFCDDHERFQLDDLKEFAKEIGAPINHKVVRAKSIRIDEEHFLSPDCIRFDVEKIDDCLERDFCVDDFLPLQDIAFLSFLPNIDGVKWTKYLLESYLYMQYSNKFILMNNSFLERDVKGAMVRKSSSIKDYDTLLLRVLLCQKDWESKEDVLGMLVAEGYLGSASYKGIDAVMERARMERKRMAKGE